MCDELKEELDEGNKLAVALVEHLDRVGAAGSEILVRFEGRKYLVIVKLINDQGPTHRVMMNPGESVHSDVDREQAGG